MNSWTSFTRRLGGYLVVMATLLLFPAVAHAGTYTVQPGDCLYNIGLKYGVDYHAIMDANHLDSALIHPGQELNIPGAGNGGNSGEVSRSSDSLGDARLVLAKADSLQGKRYVYGASGPNSFDCSGFTRYVFQSAGISLPHNAAEQYQYGRYVPRDDLKPGDLVFFSSYGRGIDHVGIYAGNDSFISATTSGGVRYASLDNGYFADKYQGAKRLLR
ncbi:LysM peptidoglycan-binding domain-containing C40 family peptidase [Desulfotomaculum copahuensis]|uniref:Uncharacterized protein n=1 Tax=Desulfotomaculum copahuensis TaxID=1838280 RepID=A0A1B7LAD3_9FIRM|nr:LysM peptidoglycan-binding domain-containing C40 family peptidase [Desulfotomaculum copahuensis]OAT79292.1 hypothetical protein A6M21_16425 [Desulfotomaculum copahuensis]